MLYMSWAVVFFLLFLMFLVNKTLVSSVEKMSNPTGLIERVAQIDDERFQLKFNAFDAWAKQNGFVHDCLFLSHVVLDGSSMQCSVWWNETHATLALMYYHKGKHIYDFASNLTDDSAVTTASSKDALTLPHSAQNRVQAFANLSFDELLQKHLVALNMIKSKVGVTEQRTRQDVIREIEITLVKQMAYVQTIAFWRYKGAYWYFICRNILVNKPIRI